MQTALVFKETRVQNAQIVTATELGQLLDFSEPVTVSKR